MQVPATLFGTNRDSKRRWQELRKLAVKRGNWTAAVALEETRVVESNEEVLIANEYGLSSNAHYWHLYWPGRFVDGQRPLSDELLLDGVRQPWFAAGIHANFGDMGWALRPKPGRNGHYYVTVLDAIVRCSTDVLALRPQVSECIPYPDWRDPLPKSMCSWNSGVLGVACLLYPGRIESETAFGAVILQSILAGRVVSQMEESERAYIHRGFEIKHQQYSECCTLDWTPTLDEFAGLDPTAIDVLLAAGIVELVEGRAEVVATPTVDLNEYVGF